MVLIKIPKQYATPSVLEQIDRNLKESKINKIGSDYSISGQEYCILCNGSGEVMNIIFRILEESFSKDFADQIQMNYIPMRGDNDTKMEQDILDALRDDRVVIYLQPIYSNKAKRFVSGEVLTRIIMPDGTLLPPGEFIPVAEQSKLINILEKRILEKTLRFLAEVDIHALGLNFIELNMSIKTSERNDFADICTHILKTYDINPSYLNVEITETASISEKENLLANMKKLIDRGFHFSLDDFGSGYSNLNYVIDMPVSVIKFDLNMTQATGDDKKAYIVMKHAVHMAHELELTTIAEGVETKESLQRMVDMGIDYIQGYYFSKPLPVNEFVAFIEERNKDYIHG